MWMKYVECENTCRCIIQMNNEIKGVNETIPRNIKKNIRSNIE